MIGDEMLNLKMTVPLPHTREEVRDGTMTTAIAPEAEEMTMSLIRFLGATLVLNRMKLPKKALINQDSGMMNMTIGVTEVIVVLIEELGVVVVTEEVIVIKELIEEPGDVVAVIVIVVTGQREEPGVVVAMTGTVAVTVTVTVVETVKIEKKNRGFVMVRMAQIHPLNVPDST